VIFCKRWWGGGEDEFLIAGLYFASFDLIGEEREVGGGKS